MAAINQMRCQDRLFFKTKHQDILLNEGKHEIALDVSTFCCEDVSSSMLLDFPGFRIAEYEQITIRI